MRRVLVVLGLVAGMLLLTPTQAIACSCVLRSVAEQVEAADTVIAGTVEWTSTDGQERRYSVRVEDLFKGEAADYERLTTPAHEAACGLGELAVDRRYLFFIDGRHGGLMRVNLCGGSTGYDEEVVAQIVAVTGPPRPAISEPRPIESEDGGSASPWWTILGLSGAGGVLAAAVLLGRRRREQESPDSDPNRA